MPLLLWHVSLQAGGRFSAETPAGFELGAYVISGEAGLAGGTSGTAGQLVVYEGTDGALEIINNGRETLDMLVLGGAPAEGPLVFHGPFVMNSIEQIRHAERAYHEGRMGALAEA